MVEQRRQYRISNPQNILDLANQVNRQFSAIADRFDEMEGFRGTPTFRSNIDLGGNKAVNAALAETDTDLATKYQVESSPSSGNWPIGSIFVSSLSTNPATLLGLGTWSVVGTGQLHIGTGDKGSGLVGSYSSSIENVLEPRTLIYIWKRTA